MFLLLCHSVSGPLVMGEFSWLAYLRGSVCIILEITLLEQSENLLKVEIFDLSFSGLNQNILWILLFLKPRKYSRYLGEEIIVQPSEKLRRIG